MKILYFSKVRKKRCCQYINQSKFPTLRDSNMGRLLIQEQSPVKHHSLLFQALKKSYLKKQRPLLKKQRTLFDR